MVAEPTLLPVGVDETVLVVVIGLMEFFMISSLASGTNLWPMLGSLLTKMCVNDVEDVASDDADNCLLKRIGESKAVTFDNRLSRLESLVDGGIGLKPCSSSTSDSSNLVAMGMPSVSFRSFLGGTSCSWVDDWFASFWLCSR